MERYPKIVQACLEVCPRTTILQLQYKPCLTTDLNHYGVYRALSGLLENDAFNVDDFAKIIQTLPKIAEAAGAGKLVGMEENGGSKSGNTNSKSGNNGSPSSTASNNPLLNPDADLEEIAVGIIAGDEFEEDDDTSNSGNNNSSSSSSSVTAPAALSSGMRTMNLLMETIYNVILATPLVHDSKLQIIDLPNSFSPTNENLYRSQIEPSGLGGRVISGLILSVIGKLGIDQGDGGTQNDTTNLDTNPNNGNNIELQSHLHSCISSHVNRDTFGTNEKLADCEKILEIRSEVNKISMGVETGKRWRARGREKV
jgi:hypothetical protein